MNPNLEAYFKAAEEWKTTLGDYELMNFYSKIDKTADKTTGDSEDKRAQKNSTQLSDRWWMEKLEP